MAGRTGTTALAPIIHDAEAPPTATWSFAASARKLDPSVIKGENALGTESPEHREAWLYYDEIGEVGQMVSASAGLLSQCKLYVGWVDEHGDEHRLRDQDGKPAEGFDEQFVADCEGVLSRYVDQGGSQRGLLVSHAENFDVTGDAYLVGWPVDQDGNPWDQAKHGALTGDETERWEVVSRGALNKEGGRWLLQLSKSTSIKLPKEGATVYRFWRKHPRRPDDSRGWVLQALDICRDLRIFTLAQRSAARSGIPAPILAVAEEASPRNLTVQGTPDSQQVPDPTGMIPNVNPLMQASSGPGEAPAQPLPWAQRLEKLIGDAVFEVLRDAQSGRAVIPPVLSVNSEYFDKFHMIELARPIDKALHELVTQARNRLAESADCPPEMLRGLGETNRWNGAQIADDEYRRYFRPKAMAIADSWTVELLWGGLEALSYDPIKRQRVRVLVDATGVVAEPDIAKYALDAFKAGAIGWPALRRALGFTETDAATQEEIDFVLALYGKAAVGALAGPAATGQAPAGSENSEVNQQAGSAAPHVYELEAPDPVVGRRPSLAKLRTRTAASIPIKPTGRALAQQLSIIEQQARGRIEEAAEIAFDQALQRAGAKLQTWARRNQDLRAVVAKVPAGEVADVLGAARAKAIADTQFTGADSGQRRREDMFAAALVALLASFERVATAAYGQALDLLDVEMADEQIAVNVAAGSSVLRESMLLLADQRVFDPQQPPTVGEMRALNVPTPVTRRAMAAAGGASVEPGIGPLSDASAGLVFGPALAPYEPQILEWEWDYGSAPRTNPYEPHMEIDGETFSGPDDPALDGVAPDGGPGFPGDHGGCECDWVPVLADGEPGDDGE